MLKRERNWGGGRVVCAGLDLLPSHRKKVQREQIWDQRRYAAWLHTLHHPFIRVDAHGASMSHTAILLECRRKIEAMPLLKVNYILNECCFKRMSLLI